MVRRRAIRFSAVGLVFALLSAGTVRADKPVLQIRLATRIAMAPADLRGFVRVTPDAGNRMLRVVVDSDDFYRSSDIQLEGDRSPQSHFLQWRALPPGDYKVVVTVFGAEGLRSQLSQPFMVIDGLPGGR